MNTKTLYVNSCCCTCLSTENLQNLHVKDADNVKLIDKLLSCFSEKDTIFQSAPLLMCQKCCKNIQELYNFRKASMKNLDLVRNCLQQLVRNTFSDLSLAINDKTNEVTQTNDSSRQNVSADPLAPVEVENVVVKQEENDDVSDYETFKLDEINNVELPDSNQPMIQIRNVESLHRSCKNSTVVSSEASTSACNLGKETSPRKFEKDTICHPCGKKFIRDDFFIKHMLTCSKHDATTKNEIILWASRKNGTKKNVKINDSTLRVINNYAIKAKIAKNELLDASLKESEAPIIVDKRKNILNEFKKDRFERTVCHLCKRAITTRFFRRHLLKCTQENNNSESDVTVDELQKPDTDDAPKNDMDTS